MPPINEKYNSRKFPSEERKDCLQPGWMGRVRGVQKGIGLQCDPVDVIYAEHGFGMRKEWTLTHSMEKN